MALQQANTKEKPNSAIQIEGLEEDASAAKPRRGGVIEKYNLPENYKILVDKPLPELNSAFARAFEVTDSRQKQGLYAMVLPNTFPIRFRVIQKLKEYFNVNFANVVEAGFTDVAGGQYGNYAVVIEKPRGKSLFEHLRILKEASANNQSARNENLISDDFLAKEIIGPINEILNSFHQNEICHGLINPKNIYLESLEVGRGKLILGECISEPCGYSQAPQYEVIPRAQCLPLGKGESSIANDYYSLGVLALYTVFGELPNKNTDVNDFIMSRLVKGSYNTTVSNLELSQRVTDLLRGLLNDTPQERWGYDQVASWVKGKQYNLIRPSVRKEAIRAFDFVGASHSNRRSLAQAFHLNWDEALPFLRDKKIVKWLELSVNQRDASDEINSIIITTGGENSKSRRDNDELTAKSLIILDPQAPIRFRKIVANVDGLGVLLANAWQSQNQVELQTISEIFRLNLPDYKSVKDPDNEKTDRWVLQKLNSFIKINALGFGIERCIYDLNPTLPCQSNLLAKQFIIDISQLLYYLNDNATKLAAYEPVDRHIAGFIASKLELSQEVGFKQAKRLRDDNAKQTLIKLAMLAFAQKKANIPKLFGLTDWLAEKLDPIVESLNSSKIRDEMKKELVRAAKTGSLDSLLQLIINSDFFVRDTDGFIDAKNRYKIFSAELRNIQAARKASIKTNSHYLYGLYVAKIISVMTFLITLGFVAV